MDSENFSTELIQLTENTFGRGGLILDYALETSLFHSDNSSKYIQFLVIPFLDRELIWINPEKIEDGGINSQRVRVCALDRDGYGDYGYVMKFLSALCFLADGPVVNVSYSASGLFPGSSCRQRTHIACLNGFEIDLLFSAHDWKGLSDRCWAELAYYRQAINSRSPYLSYLSHWKVIESRFSYSPPDVNKFINDSLRETQLFSEWKERSQDIPSKRLRITRDRAAHAFLDRDSLGLQNPDNPVEYMSMKEHAEIIEFLSSKAVRIELDRIR
jgi:hypothetical protein